MKKIGKWVWIFSGTLCIALGVLGIFLPVLPTTPFLLLAAFCYGRGSNQFYHWLVFRSSFGGTIRNYYSGLGIPFKQKVLTILFLWVTIGSTVGFVALAWWLKMILGVVAIGVTIHLVTMRNRHPASSMQIEQVPFAESVEKVL
jgi:uncharacterized membrane protein YbaN (DUF454 family)